MTRSRCPLEAELVRYVDAALAPESSDRINGHLGQCSICSQQVRELRLLVEDLGSVHAIEFDVGAHVNDVMCSLDQPAAPPKRHRAMVRVAAVTAMAASLGLVLHFVGSRHGSSSGIWQARGSSNGESLSRDIGVQIYTLAKSLQPLRPGGIIASDVALTAGLRNLGHATAYVMLFAIDSRNAVHWITPKYARVDENPTATELTRSEAERVLPTSVVFDDMAEGPMRIVTIVSPVLIRVSQVEGLAESELVSRNLVRHFAGAEIREIAVQVRSANQGNTR